MGFLIDSTALEALSNPVTPIRVKALKRIIDTIKNNILFQNKCSSGASTKLKTDEISVVDIEQLVRYLIQWFSFKPILNENEVLDLLISILARQDFFNFLTKRMSVTRLLKEINKIKKIVTAEKSFLQIEQLRILLNNYESMGMNDSQKQYPESTTSFKKTSNSIDNLSEQFQKCDLNEPLNSFKRSALSKCDEMSINIHWEMFSGEEIETFKSINSDLCHKNSENLERVLKQLNCCIEDYPPEFFLQPPDILQNLINILPKVNDKHVIQIIILIRFIVCSIKDSLLNYKETSSNTDDNVAVKRHINQIVLMINNRFQKFLDHFNTNTFKERQEEFIEFYHLLVDLINFFNVTRTFCEIYLIDLLNVMSKLTKNFRVSYSETIETDSFAPVYKTHYIVMIYLINNLVALLNFENSIALIENNVWELECDVALMDIPLKAAHPGVYKILKRNRINNIMEDQDLLLMLQGNARWIEVVDLFKNWENLTSEEILFKGLKAIETLSVHQSQQLVILLLDQISKCADKYNTNQELKEAADTIFLRFLAFDLIEIKRLAYKTAGSLITKRLTDQTDNEPSGRSICAVMGIPMTPEIITEVLCFGYTNVDQEVNKYAKLILYALLNSKCVYKNDWPKILEVLKPVISLMPCLFDTNNKLLIFSMDILNNSSGFDNQELMQAYTRYLFCGDAKARKIAKVKLLNYMNEPEFSFEFIEMIPDDFCLLKDHQVMELVIPEANVSCDTEIYQITCDVLKNINAADVEVVQSTLLQLSIMMNSVQICHKSHDDNLWVFFLASTTAKFQNIPAIRKLTIDILYKWTVTVPNFRIYLANDQSVLVYLIKTLIYFQEDEQMKRLCSCLLFLLMYSDFFVLYGKSVSLPGFFSLMKCPFKHSQHWIESPFNDLTSFEGLYKEIVKHRHETDVYDITHTYLRFIIGTYWFGDIKKLMSVENFSNSSYSEGCNVNALKIHDKLMLSQQELFHLYHSAPCKVFERLGWELDNCTSPGQIFHTLLQIECFLLLPVKITNHIELLDKKLKKYLMSYPGSKPNRRMFAKVLNIYLKIIPSETKSAIQKWIPRICEKEFALMRILKEPKETDDVYYELLMVIVCVFKTFAHDHESYEKEIKSIERQMHFHFPTKVFEILVGNLEIDGKPILKKDSIDTKVLRATLMAIRTLVCCSKIQSEDLYMNRILGKLIDLASAVMYSDYMGSAIVKCVMTIAFKMLEFIDHIDLSVKHFKLLFSWCGLMNTQIRSLVWCFLGQMTKKKDRFIRVVTEFNDLLPGGLFGMILNTILEESEQPKVKMGAVTVLGNILDHEHCGADKENNLPKNGQHDFSELIRENDFYNVLITNLSGPENIKSLCFIIRKLVHLESPEIVEIVNHNLIKDFFNFKLYRREVTTEHCLETICDILETVGCCWKINTLRTIITDGAVQMHAQDFGFLCASLYETDCWKSSELASSFKHNVINFFTILCTTESGLEYFHNFMSLGTNFENLIPVLCDGLQITNRYTELMFYLGFLNTLLTHCELFNSPMMRLFDASSLTQISEFALEAISIHFDQNALLITNAKSNLFMLEQNFNIVQFTVDIFLLQLVSIWNSLDSSKYSAEYKNDLKCVCFLVLKKLMSNSERARYIANVFNLIGMSIDSFNLQLVKMQNLRYAEATRKMGVQKCQIMLKDICFHLKTLTDWNLQHNDSRIKDLFVKILKISDWIDADVIIMNSFLSLVNNLNNTKFGKQCLFENYDGNPVIKAILKKMQKVTSRVPHTDSNKMLLRNGINTIQTACRLVDVRILLKNSKVFQILEHIHPQLHRNRRSTWDEVTIEWLKFFEHFSRFEDVDCNPSHISLFCRLIRLGNPIIKSITLKIIRNVSLKASIGFVILMSDDYKDTVDDVLNNKGPVDEKILVIETLLSISSKCEQMKSKIKNSSLNRKLKDHFAIMKADSQNLKPEIIQLYNLTEMLNQLLYA
ncbi:unnamed protein product [Diamesa serratosioi]